jgi:hypothetical protein
MPWTRKALPFTLFFRNSDHTVLNDLMNGKNVEGKDCNLIQGTILAFVRRPGTQESHKIYQAS